MGELESNAVHTFTRLEHKARAMCGMPPRGPVRVGGLEALRMTAMDVRAALQRAGATRVFTPAHAAPRATPIIMKKLKTIEAAPAREASAGGWEDLQPLSAPRNGAWSARDARLARSKQGAARLVLGPRVCELLKIEAGSKLALCRHGKALGLSTAGGLFEVRRTTKKPADRSLTICNAALRAIIERPGAITYRMRAGAQGEPDWVLEALTSELR